MRTTIFRSKRFLALLSTLALLASAAPGYAQSHPSDNSNGRDPSDVDAHCYPLTIPVALGAGLAMTDQVSGTLCLADNDEQHRRQVDVLVPGATYTRTYWDWPVQSNLYSYVRHTLKAGRSTFAYDRL